MREYVQPCQRALYEVICQVLCSWPIFIKVNYNMSNTHKNFTVLFLLFSTNCYYHNSINQVMISSTRLINFCVECRPDISPCKGTWMLIVPLIMQTSSNCNDNRALDAGELVTATPPSPELLEEIYGQQHIQPSKQQNKPLHHTHFYRSRDIQLC
jgi:hypothetical protein